MNILYICEKWPNATKPTWDWQIDSFIEMGNTVEVLAADRSEDYSPEISENNDQKIISSYYPSTLKNILSKNFLNFNIFRLLSRLKYIKLIFAQQINFKDKVMQYFRFCCISCLYPDYIIVKNLVTASQFTFLKQIFSNRVIVLYYHGGVIPGVPTDFYRHNTLVFKMCDKIFTNTEYAKSDLMNLGATEDKVNILPVGLDLKKFEIDLPKKYKTNCKLKLLTISRIAEEKGIIHAVKAVEKLIKVGRNNISYIIVGSGPSLQSIQDYIKSNKLNEYVKCVGYISNNILRNSYYKTADIIIVPSISTKDWEENQCIAIQEAGLMHIPCIASITGGLPEVVKNEITGYLIPPGDEERIAEIIIKFLDMQYKKMSEMGESAFIFTSKKYDIKSISKTILNIIKQ